MNIFEYISINNMHNVTIFYSDDDNNKLTYVLNKIKTMNCLNSAIKGAFCDQCDICKSINDFSNPDCKFIIPTVSNKNDVEYLWKQNIIHNMNMNKNDWTKILDSKDQQLIINKDLTKVIIDYISIPSKILNYKYIIIWLVEMMNSVSINMLLKILEDPVYDNSMFFMISNDYYSLLPTLRSRATKEYIYQNYDILDDNIDTSLQWLRLCYSLKYENIYKFIEDLSTKGKEYVKSVIKTTIYLLENLLYKSINVSIKNSLSLDVNNALDKLSKILDIKKIINISKYLEEMYIYIKRNANLKIVILELSRNIHDIFAS